MPDLPSRPDPSATAPLSETASPPLSDERSKRLATIFAAALDLHDPAKRTEFLAKVCGAEESLRLEVEGLLRAYDGQFIDDPAAKTGEPGDRIGNYILREELGHGTFGVVWVADQEEPVRRRVALKILKPGMDTREILARFEQERQALAVMDHPGIAKIFDAGATSAGLPFFAMELVHGIKITDYCDQENLTADQRLELFIQVCQAVQHAHQKGIIHRDLKPTNVLVALQNDVPVPKVIDFGVAKATYGRLSKLTIYTGFRQMIGTPAYMSPEQAEMSAMDIDTRADIYSLGVLLYELLVGQPPFDPEELMSRGFDEIRRIIREQEPPKPSTRFSTLALETKSAVAHRRKCEPPKLAGLLRGDLDWIVMKALEKDRTRRYETANGFASDVRRYLAGEPVLAAAPSKLYKFGKFARRNKVALATALGVLTILVTATIVSLSQASLAKTRLIESEKARQEAEDISGLFTEVLARASPGVDGAKITVASALDRAVEVVNSEIAGQPIRQARLKGIIGATYNGLGLSRQALPLLEEAMKVQRALLGTEHQHSIATMRILANAYSETGRLKEALDLREEVLALAKKVLGPRDPVTIGAMSSLANSYYENGHREEALKLHEQALADARSFLGSDHFIALAEMLNVAHLYVLFGREKDALELEEQALALNSRAKTPNFDLMVTGQSNLAFNYQATGRQDEALKLRLQAAELSEKIFGPEHPRTLKELGRLADYYLDLGRRTEGLELRSKVVEISRKTRGPASPETADLESSLADVYSDAGRYKEALALREEVLSTRQKLLPPESPELLMAMGKVASSYFDFDRLDDGRKLLEETWKLQRKVLGQEASDTLWTKSVLATVLCEDGRQDEALQMRLEVLASCRKTYGSENRLTINAIYHLALSYRYLGRTEEALKLFQEVLDLERRAPEPQPALTVHSLRELAHAQAVAGHREEALKLRQEVLALSRKTRGEHHEDTLVIMSELASSLSDSGQKDAAFELRKEALNLSRNFLSPDHRATRFAMEGLANEYEATGNVNESMKLREALLASVQRARGPDHIETLHTMNRLAAAYIRFDRQALALKLRKEALALSQKLFGAEHAETIEATGNLAASLVKMGSRDEAVLLQEEVLNLSRKSRGPEQPETLAAMQALATIYADAGRTAEGMKLQEEILPLSRKIFGPEHLKTINAMTALARCYDDAKRDAEALAVREERLKIRTKVSGANHPETVFARDSLVHGYVAMGRVEEALAVLSEALADGPDNGFTGLKLGALQVWFGKYADHAVTCQRMFEWAEKIHSPEAFERAAKVASLSPKQDAKILETALTLARRAVEMGTGHGWLPQFQLELGMAEYRNGHFAAADEMLEFARKGVSKQVYVTGTARYFQAMSLFQQGKTTEARRIFAETKAKMSPFPENEKNPLAGKAHHDELILWLAYKEAQALFESPGKGPK